MDGYFLNSFGRALSALATHAQTLDDLLALGRGKNEEITGAGSRTCRSKPPVNLAMLDLKNRTEQLLCFWSERLRGVLPDEARVPVDRSIDARARWLLGYLAYFDDLPGGELAATEIIAQAELILEVIGGSDEQESPPEYGSCRVVASWLVNRGYSVSHMRVHRWAKSGKVRTRAGEHGAVLVCYDDAERLCYASIGSVTPLGVS